MPTEIIVDGFVRIAGPPRFPVPARCIPAPAGYLIAPVDGGLEVTAPDGCRLLCAAGPGSVPLPTAGAARYDAVLLDLLGEPAQLGQLRNRGLVSETTAVAPIYVDHRLPSQQELVRRCRLWRVTVASDGDRLIVPGRHGQAVPDLPRPWRVLLLGGASSGKSREAELRLAAEPNVTYVAAAAAAPAAVANTAVAGAAVTGTAVAGTAVAGTAPARGRDAEWSARVTAHRARRPSWWKTVETTDVAAELRTAPPGNAVLIDSIGGWLAAVLEDCGAWRKPPGDALAASRLAERTDELIAAWQGARCHVIAVSDETGSGVVPPASSGRIFRDELGRLNQLLAAQSEEAILVVAGRALSLPG